MGTSIFSRGALIVGCLLAAVAARGGFWDWTKPYQGPNKDIITLVVTGNYTKPRLMADLIQEEIRQPYLLLPVRPEGKIFFIPVRGEALEVREGDMTKFVKFLNPRRIMVLGDASYVPERYLNLIDKSQTIVVVRNRRWNKSAAFIGKVLNLTNLADDFSELSAEIDAGELYKPDELLETDEIFEPEEVFEPEEILESAGTLEPEELIVEESEAMGDGDTTVIGDTIPGDGAGDAIVEEQDPVLIEE